MKKLMIAAALAAMTVGAYADCKDPGTEPTGSCARFYKAVFNAKTTVGERGTIDIECNDPVNVCVAKLGSRKIVGIIFSCDCEPCGENDLVVSDSKKEYYWDATEQVWIEDGALKWDFLNRFAEKKTQGLFTFADTADAIKLTGAGFGNYSRSAKNIHKIKGYFAGYLDAAVCDRKCHDPMPTAVFNLCDNDVNVDGLGMTAAYGSWKIVYKADRSEQLTRKQKAVVQKELPSYVWEEVKSDFDEE